MRSCRGRSWNCPLVASDLFDRGSTPPGTGPTCIPWRHGRHEPPGENRRCMGFCAVCRAFPNALIWGPTQLAQDANWDYGVSLGDGKLFILEDKATRPVTRKRKRPLSTHWINVPRAQLDWYCDEVEPKLGVPVFYVLPAPPWEDGLIGSVAVPDQAICRIAPGSGPFEEWTYVARAPDLRRHLARRRGLETNELPIPRSQALAAFLDAIGTCALGQRITGPGDGAESAAKGVPRVDSQTADAREQLTVRDQLDRRAGSALAVFVPARDLPGW